MRKKKNIWVYMVLIILSIILLFPFYWMLRSSFMTDREIFSITPKWLPDELLIENYIKAFQTAPFVRYFMNSFVIVAANVVGAIFSSSFAAFGFTRFRFRGRDFFFGLLISTMMIPYTVLMIPQFIGWQAVGAYNTYWPLILPAFFGSAFNIFLVKQFYMGIPREYDEAALVDGANYLTIYGKIILPMSKPALCTVGVFTFMNTWNDFMGPLLYLNSQEKKTVSLGLQMFIGQFSQQWNLLMAAATVVMIPMIIVFFMAQKYFIEGITFSGLKG